jgi:outer membrane protein OmpA-like peptidoglycan-associated protein
MKLKTDILIFKVLNKCFDDHNLSVSRALAVYTYLAQKGIDRSRLTFKGFSNTLPVVFPEITDEDRTKNRRVDVEIVKD